MEIARSADSQAAFQAVETAPTQVVNACDECSGTALHFLAAEGHVQACRALLSREDFEEISARNGIGSTALHIAAANDEEEICKMILEDPRFTSGASVANDNGQTPLDHCRCFVKIVNFCRHRQRCLHPLATWYRKILATVFLLFGSITAAQFLAALAAESDALLVTDLCASGISILVLLLVSVSGLLDAVHDLEHPREKDRLQSPLLVLIFGFLGICFDLISFWGFYRWGLHGLLNGGYGGFGEGSPMASPMAVNDAMSPSSRIVATTSMNMRSAFMHVGADLLRSMVTVAEGLLVLWGHTNGKSTDSYSSLIVSLTILCGVLVGLMAWGRQAWFLYNSRPVYVQAFCKQREDKPALAEEEADTSTAGPWCLTMMTRCKRWMSWIESWELPRTLHCGKTTDPPHHLGFHRKHWRPHQQTSKAEPYKASRLIPAAGALVAACRTCGKWRRKPRSKASSRCRVAPVAGSYDGVALDEYFGKEPLTAVSRFIEVISRINTARSAWQDDTRPVEWRGERVRQEVACLGTVFVKLAQTLATRSDLVSQELGKELGVLQDSMGRFPDDVAMQTISEDVTG
eukprot:symbB.v1.2.026904.t2/scaffold2726.1/size72210/2